MPIAVSTNSIATAYANYTAARTTDTSASEPDAAASATTASSSSAVKTVDFTHMTRQQLFDWMNSQLKSGKMTFDQSSGFLGMTVKVSMATGQPVDMASDSQRYNFMDVAQQGLEGAKSRNEEKQVQALE